MFSCTFLGSWTALISFLVILGTKIPFVGEKGLQKGNKGWHVHCGHYGIALNLAALDGEGCLIKV